MKLAVLSGKGGTGKTLVSVNLAAIMEDALYLDCDVEAPNGHLFFKPCVEMTQPITVKIPKVNQQLCTGCRVCTDFCRFNAMAYIGGQVKVFDDVCHSCGGCTLLCPSKAITEYDKNIGIIQIGMSENVRVGTGIMKVGEASGVPIIDHLMDFGHTHKGNVVVDCPPGSGCTVMESIKDADYCLIVAEPTLYGSHNMKMVQALVTEMGKPMGVVINKSYGEDQLISNHCRKIGVKILGRIGYSEKLADFGSKGRIAVREDPSLRTAFEDILYAIEQEVAYEATACS